jgi:hypothetical protein
MTSNVKIFNKVDFLPSGFILQKDVYTTNLLYANDRFPLTSLKKRLPFRPISRQKIPNPNDSIQILRQNGKISENSERKNIFYLLNDFKPKALKKRKLRFPLPKIKYTPLSDLNYYEEISKKDLRIKNIEDDLNIYSKNGKKIIYRFKENNLTNNSKSNFPLIIKHHKTLSNSKTKRHIRKIRRGGDKSMDKLTLTNVIDQLNDNLKNIRQLELERKKAFIKDKFFSTQIYVDNFIESHKSKNEASNHKMTDINYH